MVEGAWQSNTLSTRYFKLNSFPWLLHLAEKYPVHLQGERLWRISLWGCFRDIVWRDWEAAYNSRAVEACQRAGRNGLSLRWRVRPPRCSKTAGNGFIWNFCKLNYIPVIKTNWLPITKNVTLEQWWPNTQMRTREKRTGLLFYENSSCFW